jgi:Fe-S-cluster containining protein
VSKTQIPIQQADGRMFYDMTIDDNPCFGRNACCYHYRVSFYHGEIDSQPGGFVPAHLTSPVTPFLACMRGTANRDMDDVLPSRRGHCAIYNQHPFTCREFRALLDDGSRHPECQHLRELYGIDN